MAAARPVARPHVPQKLTGHRWPMWTWCALCTGAASSHEALKDALHCGSRRFRLPTGAGWVHTRLESRWQAPFGLQQSPPRRRRWPTGELSNVVLSNRQASVQCG